MEVDVGVVQAEAGPAVLEHAEHEPPPALGVERAVEEGAAFELLSPGGGVRRMLEDDRQRIVPGGGADASADGLGVIGRAERDGGAVRVGRGVVGVDFGFGLAEKMLGREVDAPARGGLAVRRARAGRDGAAAPREAEHAHTGRVLAAHQVLAPAVLGERQQDTRVGDAGAVVGHGHGGVALGAGDGDMDPPGAGPAGVLQNLGEGVGECRGKHPGDALDGGLVDACADGRRVVHVRSP